MARDINHPIIFSGINVEEISPVHYDSTIFTYRYQNGQNADKIGGFQEIRMRLQNLLRRQPMTSEDLSRKLSIEHSRLQRVLDYLYTHTAEIAALDMMGKHTCYIWADARVAENIRTRFSIGAIEIDQNKYTAEDITSIATYLTNLLVLKPSIQSLEEVIEKTELLLDKATMLKKLQPGPDIENRVELLQEKLQQLKKRKNDEIMRWGSSEAETASETEEKGIVGDIKENKDLILAQNGRVRKLGNRVWYLYGILGLGGGGAGIFGLVKLLS